MIGVYQAFGDLRKVALLYSIAATAAEPSGQFDTESLVGRADAFFVFLSADGGEGNLKNPPSKIS